MTDRHRYPRQIRVSQDVGDRLHDEAAARDVTPSWLANRLLIEALERLKPLDDFRLTHDG